MSAFFEQDQWTTSFAAGWPFVGAVVFTAIVVSVGAHTAYYFLIQRYEANLLAPLTLITPIATIGFGIAITGDPFDLQMAAGAVVALLGVLIVALRTRPSSALLLDREER
jgi:drug/metabolite transporter (DMT)-like permease